MPPTLNISLLASLPYAEETSHTVDDSGVQQNQEFDTGNNDEQPADKEVSKADWFKKPERPPIPDPDWNKRQCVDFRPLQTWISKVARAKEPTTSFDELINTPIDFSAFILNRLNIKDLTQAILVGPAFDLLKGTCKSLTELNHRGHQVIPQDSLSIMKPGESKGGYLSRRYSTSITKTNAATYEIKWIEYLVQNLWSPDHQLYKFREGDFSRLRLQDIEDMLLLLVQQKLTNLTIDERLNLRNKTAYTTYSDPKGVIYKDQNNRNRLMRTDELHKVSNGTLNDVRTALHDIASGIRMEYLPKRKRSGLDKRRAQVDPHGFEDLHKDGHGGWCGAIMESDSQTAISLSSSKVVPPWSLGALIDDIRTWSKSLHLFFSTVEMNKDDNNKDGGGDGGEMMESATARMSLMSLLEVDGYVEGDVEFLVVIWSF
ncbi:hypothetical protein Tco_0631149 [Tanacetum coccineum]